MKPGEIALAIMLAFGIFVSIPCWIWTLWERHKDRKDSLRHLTPEQYQDFIRRAAEQGAAYLERTGGRIHHLDMMRDGISAEDPRFEEELKRRLRGKR